MSDKAPDAPVDLHRVLVEIEDDVRAKRASGELPGDLERELDLVFARFAPAGAMDGDFEQLMARAEQQAYFDLLAPNESVRPGVPHVKRIVQKTIRWYLRYIIEQVTGFAHTITKATRRLGDRVDRIEQLAPPADELAAVVQRRPPVIGAEWEPKLVTGLAGTTGRVLHARCGAGDLVRSLVGSGLDAYGVDPAPELVAAGTADPSGLDLRPDDELAHLRSLAPGSLGGLVLSHGVDVLPRGAQIELVDLASVALRKGGRLAVLAANPVAWGRTRSPLEVDLAPGRPMHVDTWRHLLEDRGFTVRTVDHGAREGSLDRVPGGDETAAAMNVNIDRLNDLLFPPATSLLIATR